MNREQTAKKLAIEGCNVFVCPNINYIKKICTDIGLSDEISNKSVELAKEYFKKTYKQPHHHSGAKILFPSFIYIASILCNDPVTQAYLDHETDVRAATISKWYKDIIDVLNIDIMNGTP